MHNLVQKPWFYIGLICWFVLLTYTFVWTTFSFSWLGLWSTKQNQKTATNYVPKWTVDDTAIALLTANVKLWTNSYNYNIYVTDAITLLQSSSTLIQTDVIQLLDWSSKKATILEGYISQLEFTSAKMQDNIAGLQLMATEHNQESVTCDAAKKVWDSNFFQWINLNDAQMVIEWMIQSSESGPCYMKERVLANAYTTLVKKLQFQKTLIDKKLSIVQTNSDTIINNFQVFKDKSAAQLLSLQNQLLSFNVK